MTRSTLDAPDEGAKPVAAFADRLRDETAAVHRLAERAGIIADLIRARATRHGYATYLRNLVPAYAALEAALDRAAEHAHPLAAFADPALRRLPALEADLVALAGTDWARTCPLVPEAEAYAAAIASIQGDKGRLIAHAYARYLGDLSGGQILKPLLARTLGLGPDALAVYEFPGLPDVGEAKARLRGALNEIPVHGSDADAIVDEAVGAFRHTIALSEAVQAVAR